MLIVGGLGSWNSDAARLGLNSSSRTRTNVPNECICARFGKYIARDCLEASGGSLQLTPPKDAQMQAVHEETRRALVRFPEGTPRLRYFISIWKNISE